MKERMAFLLSLLLLFTTSYHISNVIATFPTCPVCDSPSPDSLSSDDLSALVSNPGAPAPSPEPSFAEAPNLPAQSPEKSSGSTDSSAQVQFPLVGSPEPDLGSAKLPTQTHFPLPESPEPFSGLPERVFDVTTHGAIPDGGTESSLAFLEAWDAACNHGGNSTFYVPHGTFFVGPVSFSGPCYNNRAPLVKIKGVLMAPISLDAFPGSHWIEFKSLNGIVLTGGLEVTKLDAQGSEEAWKQPSCHKSMRCRELVTSLKFSNISNGAISNIALSNGKGFHIGFYGSNNIIVRNVKITASWDSPNTDGIHISHSTNINITNSKIGVGDDCVSIGAGSMNISITNVKCGPGHGISVGSLGRYLNETDVVGINVQDCTINGTQNGIRVKTWPGSQASNASDITFKNIIMINVSNPIIVDQEYCPSASCDFSKPSLVKLSNVYIKNITGTYNTKSAVTLLCSSRVPCENISLVDINLKRHISKHGHLNVKGLVNGLEVLTSSF